MMFVQKPLLGTVTDLEKPYDIMDDFRTKHEFRLTAEDKKQIALIRREIKKLQSSIAVRREVK